jgi:hypothetical protein
MFLGSSYFSSTASVMSFRLKHLRIFSSGDIFHCIKFSCDSFGKLIKLILFSLLISSYPRSIGFFLSSAVDSSFFGVTCSIFSLVVSVLLFSQLERPQVRLSPINAAVNPFLAFVWMVSSRSFAFHALFTCISLFSLDCLFIFIAASSY